MILDLRILRWALPWLGLLGLMAGRVEAAGCPEAARPFSPLEAQVAREEATDRGLLWRAQRDGRSLWLYGTIHAARRAWVMPGPAVLAALKSADVVALELDLLDPQVAQRLQTALRSTDPSTALPQALRGRIETLARRFCLDTPLTDLLPEMQVMTLSAVSGRSEGIDPAYGIDLVLSGLAHGLGKRVVSLETPESQLEAVTERDPARRLTLMLEALDELESGRTLPLLKRLTQDWADSRLDDLSRYPEWCECLSTEAQRALHERLNTVRNPLLAREAMALHAAGRSPFVAVGALHMIGPGGLPALLAANGFAVQLLLPSPHGPGTH